MVRLTDMAASERQHLEHLECPVFDNPAFNPPKALRECRVALISSAGLMRRGDANVSGRAADYRSFTDDIADADLLINHISVNFDRSAFAEDINTVFPRQLLRDMAAQGTIGSAATEHYAFMGATAPEQLQPHVQELGARLRAQHVDTALLLPV